MPPTAVRGIPTEYAGILFRSRLEARYAAMLDILKADWEYEPDDLGGYIPDFKLYARDRFTYLEIKPAHTLEDLEPAMHKAIQAGLYGHCWKEPEALGTIAILGERPFLPGYKERESGLYCETIYETGSPYVESCTIAKCIVCGQFGWSSAFNSFTIVPCNHYQDSGGFDWESVTAAWAAAQRKVQWRGTK